MSSSSHPRQRRSPLIRHARDGRAPQAPSSELSRIPEGQLGSLVTRRAALKAMLGLTVVSAAVLSNPLRALAEPQASQKTTDALADAQQAYNDAKAKLDAISSEYEQLSEQLNGTVSQIEQVQAQIDDTQAQIDAKQKEIDAKQKEIDKKQEELSDKQDQLSQRISTNYKSGSSNLLSVVLNSTSFEDLSSNLYYLGKVNTSDQKLIDEVKQDKAQLDQQKADLETQKSALDQQKASLEQQKGELEELQASQQQQLAAVQAKQQEATSLLDGLDQNVKDLVSQRDQEILAAAEEERRQQQARATSGVTGALSNASPSEKGAAIVAACHRVGSPGGGLCAMWVSQVYSAAGLGYPGGNANNMYWNFCTSSNKADLEPGMIIAVSTHPHTSAGRTYGHVGIYVGNGTVMDNVGYIRTIALDSWISYYSASVTPRWGWAR